MAFKYMAKNQFSLSNVVSSAVVVASVAVLGFAGAAMADPLPGVDVHIGAGGNAQVEGAKVTAVSGSDVSANTSFGSTILNWIVKTDSDTEFSAKSDGKGSASGLVNIAVGDVISFKGAIDQSANSLTVKAKAVKDWTKTKKAEAKTHVSGTVSAINSSLNSFVVTNGASTTTVQTDSATKFKLNGKDGAFADLVVNAKVKVMGMFNASSSAFTATQVDIASSTHTKWNKDDKHAWRDWIRSKVWLHLGR